MWINAKKRRTKTGGRVTIQIQVGRCCKTQQRTPNYSDMKKNTIVGDTKDPEKHDVRANKEILIMDMVVKNLTGRETVHNTNMR